MFELCKLFRITDDNYLKSLEDQIFFSAEGIKYFLPPEKKWKKCHILRNINFCISIKRQLTESDGIILKMCIVCMLLFSPNDIITGGQLSRVRLHIVEDGFIVYCKRCNFERMSGPIS